MANNITRSGTGLARPGKGQVVAYFESMSRDGAVYEIRQSGDRTHLYCSCPSWRFQRKPPRARTCKHLISFEENGPELPSDIEVKALREG